MSVTGPGRPTPTVATPTTPTTTTPVTTTTTTTTTPAALRYGPFAGSPALAEVAAGTRTLGVGERGPHVKVLEEALQGLGFRFGNSRPNDSLTAITRNMIARIQRDNGLTPSGNLDKETLAVIDRMAAQRLGGGTGPTPPPVAPAAPKPTDLVPANILEKHGLSTTDFETKSKYEGQEWGSVGYYPYFGEVQYTAAAKHASVFGSDGTDDTHAYFERYSNPRGGLLPGSFIKDGSISESDFEAASGVDVTGDRPVDNTAYALLRESGSPQAARVALRDAQGKQLAVRDTDKLVPTVVRNGKAVEVEVDGNSRYTERGTGASVSDRDVTWRLKRDGGVLYDASHKAEPKDDLLGVKDGVKFDFLDAAGDLVPFETTDRIVESWKDGDKWHVLAKADGGRFEHQVVEGSRVASRETVDATRAGELKRGKEIIHRIQTTATGALKGDGKVGETFDMGWWGKCHNVASLSTTNMPRPKQEVTVMTNLQANDTAAVRWGDNVLRPQTVANKITGYVHEKRGPDGTVRSSTNLSVADGAKLATDNRATPVIVRGDGTLKDAETTRFDKNSLTALVAHVGDGAVEYVGGAGERYHAHPDVFLLKNGQQVLGHIKSIKTESGKTHSIGDRSGTEYEENDRSELRGPGMTSRSLAAGGRSMAFNIQDVAKLNAHRTDDIKSFTVINPDGTERTIDAKDVNLFGWENKLDFRPDQLWALHKTVKKDRSTVIETYTGTQVWNYSARDVQTKVLDPKKDLDPYEKKEAAKPGMMTGTVGEEGKKYFSTTIETDGQGHDLKYWAKFDAQGNITDYAYISGDPPDFVWTQHVKTDKPWTGESQARGILNADIQRLYHASQGRLDGYTLPGGVITSANLKNGVVAPANP